MKTLLKRTPTNTAGIFYKEIISKNNKVIDKVFFDSYIDANNKQKLDLVKMYYTLKKEKRSVPRPHFAI